MISMEQLRELFPELEENYKYLHQHPELGFQEKKTSSFVMKKLAEYGIEGKQVGRTGVIATIQGKHPGKTVAIRADMDALPIQEQCDLPYKSQTDGKMHACGHDAHTAMLLCAGRYLNAHRDMLTIPTVISVTAKENLSSAIYGILCGILAIPFGCLAGGFAAGFSAKLVVFNTLPVLALSLVLLIVLLIFQEAVIPAFCIFGKLLTIVSTLGLVLGAVESFLGLKLLPGLGNLEEAFPVVGGIAVYLAGALVLMNITGRVLAVPLQAVAHRLGVNTASVSALILTLANPIPTILMNREMDPKGRVLNIALVVTAGCVLGDHLAFTAQVAPELCASVIVGKVVAGAIAFCASLLLARRLLD